MTLAKTCKDIQTLKIQGANKVATAAIKAIKEVVTKSRSKTKYSIIRDVELAKKKLFNTRPTEPELRNYLNHISRYMRYYRGNNIKRDTVKEINKLLRENKNRREKIILNGSKLLHRELTIFTHCRSTTVTSILKKAAKKNKIVVVNTETRPLFQGRITAKELAKEKIKVIHHVDSAMAEAMENADAVLLGADAVTKDNYYNKVGSLSVALMAKHYHIPLYVCTTLWGFERGKVKIEERSGKEIWKNAPKEIKIHNPAFDKIPLKFVHAFVCEEGVISPKKFVKKARKVVK